MGAQSFVRSPCAFHRFYNIVVIKSFDKVDVIKAPYQLIDILRWPVKVNTRNQQQAKDTGLAILLILLLAAHLTGNITLILPAIGILVLAMAWPVIFRPLAPLWFGLAYLLGTVVSKCLLTVLFFVLVTPIGALRQIFGSDPMKLKDWQNGKGSVLLERNHTYTKTDVERPY